MYALLFSSTIMEYRFTLCLILRLRMMFILVSKGIFCSVYDSMLNSYTDSVKLISEDYLSGNVDALKIVKNMISTDLIVLAGEILLDVYVIALMTSE